ATDGPVLEIVITGDRIVIGGAFETVNGQSRHNVAALHRLYGRLDQNFATDLPGANHTVRALALQTDGRFVIAGDFTTVHGQPRNQMARLMADGSFDPTFGQGLGGANGTVFAMALDAGGAILIGGDFTAV